MMVVCPFDTVACAWDDGERTREEVQGEDEGALLMRIYRYLPSSGFMLTACRLGYTYMLSLPGLTETSLKRPSTYAHTDPFNARHTVYATRTLGDATPRYP